MKHARRCPPLCRAASWVDRNSPHPADAAVPAVILAAVPAVLLAVALPIRARHRLQHARF